MLFIFVPINFLYRTFCKLLIVRLTFDLGRTV